MDRLFHSFVAFMSYKLTEYPAVEVMFVYYLYNWFVFFPRSSSLSSGGTTS